MRSWTGCLGRMMGRRGGCAARPVVLTCVVILGGTGPMLAGAAPRAGQARATGAPGESAPAGQDRETIEKRLRDLEAAVASLTAEIARLRAAGGVEGASGAAAPIEELERRVEALSREIELLRVGEAASPPAPASAGGLGPAASKVYGARKGVSIGGYGDMLYQNFARRADDGLTAAAVDPARSVDLLDLERAVLSFGYKFNDRTLFNSEIEFEHAVAGEGEKGEVAVEFAYVDFRATKRFGLRGGLLLVPVGFLNELHEPPIFHGARRPEVEQVIIPTTWRENGAGIYGETGPVSYRAYVVTGLNATGFTAGGIREGRQEGAGSSAEDLALTARLDYTPVPGLRVGASAFTGRTGQGAPGLPRARLTLWDLHGEWNWRGLHLRGLYARTILSDAREVNQALGLAGTAGIGERMIGWYGEIAWNVLSPIRGTRQELSPFCRYEELDTQARVAPGFAADPANDGRALTCGLTYRPIPDIALKLDAQNFDNRARTSIDQVNVALGYLF